MNGAFTNDLSLLLLSLSNCAVLGATPCLCTRLGPTHLETHTRNYACPNCHLPPCLSGSSQPRFPCSASSGVLAATRACLTVCYCHEGHWRGQDRASAGPSGCRPACPGPETHASQIGLFPMWLAWTASTQCNMCHRSY